MRFGPWLTVILLSVIIGRGSAQDLDAIEGLFKWVRDLGGEVNAEVKQNSNGVRGLFATKDIPEGQYIASIPAAAIMNAGSLNDSFAVPTLITLRELKNPYSRFKPYVAIWPRPDEVINSCNFPTEYIGMLKMPYWEKNVNEWSEHIGHLLTGDLDAELEYTIKSSTRYVLTHRRRRLLMAPIFDLANHDRSCTTYLTPYESGNMLHFVAGSDIKQGEEVCYSYGNMRDDYALIHYGFLPDLEDPPRLALVDHRDFKPDSPYTHEEAPDDVPLEGEPEVLRAELQRLRNIHDELKATPDTMPPRPPGEDYLYDTLKELERRRLNALSNEIQRLSFLLNDRTEL
ncbi:hypothetical protein GPECTOR_2g1420 [Gonium pectorale]|uniref:SET domain-containing protein n=1 Tax=Gonium pectorale TaxID=33097 RepID=A0A150H166_GONPE|nr:hypothetical protein GPECTOR_2g1420 [Gonium pectorale]|eukprot:KXZ55869.1 hypothetical protein GPECTOR_2g1420 [Gonium pectorale]